MIRETIDHDIKEALKNNELDLLRTLKLVKTELIRLEKSRPAKQPIQEIEEISVLKKMIAQRKDSIDQYTKAGRTDLADVEKKELDYLTSWIPEKYKVNEEKLIEDIDNKIYFLIRHNGMTPDNRLIPEVIRGLRMTTKHEEIPGKLVAERLALFADPEKCEQLMKDYKQKRVLTLKGYAKKIADIEDSFSIQF